MVLVRKLSKYVHMDNSVNIMNDSTTITSDNIIVNDSTVATDIYLEKSDKLLIEYCVDRRNSLQTCINMVEDQIRLIKDNIDTLKMLRIAKRNELNTAERDVQYYKNLLQKISQEYKDIILKLNSKYKLQDKWSFDRETGKIILNDV